MIDKGYTINGKEYDLKEAFDLIKSGKWDKGLKTIMKTCGVKEDDARQIGKHIKDSIATHNEIMNANMEDLLADLMVTSGSNFEGYHIKKYIKPVAGETAMGGGFLTEIATNWDSDLGAESTAFSNKIIVARECAYERLIKEAVQAGANAIIGLRYDYFSLKSNMICVCVQGTAVIIEAI